MRGFSGAWAVCISILLTGCASNPESSDFYLTLESEPPPPDMDPFLIAQGTDFELTHAEFDQTVRFVQIGLRETDDSETFKPSSWVQQDVLQKLIDIKLLSSKSNLDERIRAEEKAQTRVQALILEVGDRKKLERRLVEREMTLPELQERLVEEVTSELVLRREVARYRAETDGGESRPLNENELEEFTRPCMDQLWLEADVQISDPTLRSILMPKSAE